VICRLNHRDNARVGARASGTWRGRGCRKRRRKRRNDKEFGALELN